MPGNDTHLSHISHFPQRLYGACEVARNIDSIRYILDGEPGPHNYKETADKLQDVLNIPGIYVSNGVVVNLFGRNIYNQLYLLRNYSLTKKILLKAILKIYLSMLQE